LRHGFSWDQVTDGWKRCYGDRKVVDDLDPDRPSRRQPGDSGSPHYPVIDHQLAVRAATDFDGRHALIGISKLCDLPVQLERDLPPTDAILAHEVSADRHRRTAAGSFGDSTNSRGDLEATQTWRQPQFAHHVRRPNVRIVPDRGLSRCGHAVRCAPWCFAVPFMRYNQY
jgi:hypothetical protein